jgi:hypothetical protein
MVIERLSCAQLENVAILGVGEGQSKAYFAHAQQFVSLLKGGMERKAASRLLNTFLNSVEGQAIRESHGGDIVSAMAKGPLDKMVYSYCRRGGNPSQFVSLDGMKSILSGISGVDEGMKAKLNDLYEGYHGLSFSDLTQEQADRADLEEELEQEVVSFKTFFDLRTAFFVNEAENRYIKELAKERCEHLKEKADKEKAQLECEHVKESAAKDIAMEKEKAEKEKVLRENEHLKEKAVYEARLKELELANLRMQLEREKSRSAVNGKGGSSSGGNISRKRAQESALETEDDEEERVERAEAVNVVPPIGGGNPLNRWLVAYEGEVEVTFDKLRHELPLLSTFYSARVNDRWFALLKMEKRIRSTPVMKAMLAMGLTGRVWVEVFAGCKTWVDIDIPVCNVHSSSSLEHIVRHMAKRQRAPAQFAMVVVKE